jgi:hypothetical protein
MVIKSEYYSNCTVANNATDSGTNFQFLFRYFSIIFKYSMAIFSENFQAEYSYNMIQTKKVLPRFFILTDYYTTKWIQIL